MEGGIGLVKSFELHMRILCEQMNGSDSLRHEE